MNIEDEHFLNLFKGKRVKLSLRTCSYLGVVHRVNADKSLVLEDVVHGSNGCQIPGTKVFFGREVVNVELVKETSIGSGDPDGSRHKDPPPVESIQAGISNLVLREEDDVTFVVIDKFQEKFGAAVMDIKRQGVIGVGAEGLNTLDHGRLSWLQIATKKKVYLFDILLLGTMAFRNGLSSILDNKEILKVLHDCRQISSCLIGQFGVKIANVFDTQVADVMCFSSATGGFLPDRVSSLEQALSLHLQVPSSHLLSLQTKSQLTQEDVGVWQVRPCPLPVLRLMAVSVSHLQALRLVLLDKYMMDYMDLVDSYLNNSNYKPGELPHISSEALTLPVELRKLEQMLRERREQAIKRYPVNEQGLLARFSPRDEPPPQTSPAAQEPSYAEWPEEPSPSSERPGLDLQSEPPADARASANPEAQALKPAAASDLSKEASLNTTPAPLGVGRGRPEVSMGSCSGKTLGNVESSFAHLPAVGRGVLKFPGLVGREQPVGCLQLQ